MLLNSENVFGNGLIILLQVLNPVNSLTGPAGKGKRRCIHFFLPDMG